MSEIIGGYLFMVLAGLTGFVLAGIVAFFSVRFYRNFIRGKKKGCEGKMKRPAYLQGLHIIGFFLVITGIAVGGFKNPAIGFYLVVAFLVIGLEALDVIPIRRNEIPLIIGNIRYGGIRRAVFISWGFTAAITYLVVSNFLAGFYTVAYSNLFFALGLAISSIALEVYIKLLKKFYRFKTLTSLI